MRMLISIVCCAVAIATLGSCTKHPGLTPAQNVECNAENDVTAAMSLAIAGAMNCSNQPAIHASLMTALGNVNICKKATDAQIQAAQMKAKGVQAQGILGNLACPFAVGAVIGFVSNSIPSAWSCAPSKGVPVEVFSTVVTTACEAAIPF